MQNNFFRCATHLPYSCQIYFTGNLISTWPLLSILAAVLTVSPNKQYLGMRRPTTPATTGPECIPGCGSIQFTVSQTYNEYNRGVTLTLFSFGCTHYITLSSLVAKL